MAEILYNESMCEKAYQILSRGKSIARLATDLQVCRDTIYHWRDQHPDFAKALKRGLDAAQAHWEELGESGIAGDIEKFGAAPWIFTMKNRFRADYADRHEEKQDNAASVLEKILSGELKLNK